MKEVRPLRAYAEVVLGRQRSPKDDVGPNMVPYLRAANVKDGYLELEDVKEMNFSPSEQEAFALRPGDVLVTEGSGSLSAVGASCVWGAQIEGVVCFQNTLLRLRPRASTDPRFLAWWCRYAFADGLFAAAATGANIYHLSAERLRSLPVSYLPLPRQRAIADYLDEETSRLDALVDRKRSMLALLGEKKRGVIDHLVVPRELGGDADDGGDAWPVTSLKRCVGFFADGDWIESPFITEDGIRLIQTGNVGEGHYREQGYRYISKETFAELRCTEVYPGDVLISRLAGPVGCACRAPQLGLRMVASVDVVIVRPMVVLDSDFLVYWLSSSAHLELADLLARGTTMQRLSRSQVGDMPVPVPSLETQRQAVSELSRRLGQLEAAQQKLIRQIELLREHRQALITAAVTGELEIPGVAA